MRKGHLLGAIFHETGFLRGDQLYCAFYAACCGAAENPMKGKTESECRTLLAKQYKDAVAMSALAWSPEGKAGCITVLRRLESCSPLMTVVQELAWKPACRLPGLVISGASGDACTDIGTPCTLGLWCLKTSGRSGGTCQAPRANGGICADGDECASGICAAGACAASGMYICDGK